MIVVSDTTPLRLEADEIRQKKFIVVKPVNNPESASILKRAAGLDQGESVFFPELFEIFAKSNYAQKI